MLDTSPAAPGLTPEQTPYKKKLIEVALPLQAIDAASAREKKNPPHGHPARMHQWWARRPLSACRAVLFASLVDDPSSHPERFPTLDDQTRERTRLFDLIAQLVLWENSLNEHLLAQVRAEIRESVGDALPAIYDPFCGGGAIPIEAQRLGLPTFASDLNPVAVLITKALTEIPRRFKGYAPVHPSLRGPMQPTTWERASGLAADIAAYGKWMLEQARDRIGSFYPGVQLTDGSQATVIAWLWARTVQCPNPLCGAQMPLIKSFVLSTKKGNEWCIEPIVDLQHKTIRYETRRGAPSRSGTVTRRRAICIVCNEPVGLDYVRSEGKKKRISEQMIAIVADGARNRAYLAPDEDHIRVARSARPAWTPDTDLAYNPRHMSPPLYGMTKLRDLFTSRQLFALTTFSDLVCACRERVLADAIASGLNDDNVSLESGGVNARAYADAVSTFLAFTVDRIANYGSSFASWNSDNAGRIRAALGDKKLPIVWDFAEANPLGTSSGNFADALGQVTKVLLSANPAAAAKGFVQDARDESTASALFENAQPMVCTDPPYYDNVPYADLSDFFYTWLRHSMGAEYPNLLAPLLVPKAGEIVVDAERFNGSDEKAEQFFRDGLRQSFGSIHDIASADFPAVFFYAFKESEGDDASSTDDTDSGISASQQGRASSGWEAMLTALLDSNFQVIGTWPIRTERPGRQRALNSNALASSIVLVCRRRRNDAERCVRTQFLRELRTELPSAVSRLANANLAATDLEQAAIGPGMAIFSRYGEVLENDGSRMTVRSALALINEELAQILLGEVAEVDAATHFALTWFNGHFYTPGKYDEADILLRAKNANLDPLRDAGVIEAQRGVVQLLAPRSVLLSNTARKDGNIRVMPAWAQAMHLIAALVREDGSEEAAADVLRAIGVASAERLKAIAYHCYLVCERANRSNEAQDFNALVAAWPQLARLAGERGDLGLF